MKRRDPVAIGSVGEYLLKSVQELLEVKKELDTHIQEIYTNYTGTDAQLIIAKFLEASSQMNKMVGIITYYSQYLKALSEYDKQNLSEAMKNIQSTVSEQIGSNMELYKQMEEVQNG